MKKKCIESNWKLPSLPLDTGYKGNFSRTRRQLFCVLFGLIKSITRVSTVPHWARVI